MNLKKSNKRARILAISSTMAGNFKPFHWIACHIFASFRLCCIWVTWPDWVGCNREKFTCSWWWETFKLLLTILGEFRIPRNSKWNSRISRFLDFKFFSNWNFQCLGSAVFFKDRDRAKIEGSKDRLIERSSVTCQNSKCYNFTLNFSHHHTGHQFPSACV